MKKLTLALSLALLVCAFSSVATFAQTNYETEYLASVAPRLNKSFDLDVLPEDDMVGGWKTIVRDELWWTTSVTFELDEDSDCEAEFRVLEEQSSTAVHQFTLDPGDSKTVKVNTMTKYQFQVRHSENSTQRLVGNISD